LFVIFVVVLVFSDPVLQQLLHIGRLFQIEIVEPKHVLQDPGIYFADQIVVVLVVVFVSIAMLAAAHKRVVHAPANATISSYRGSSPRQRQQRRRRGSSYVYRAALYVYCMGSPTIMMSS